MDPEMRVFVRIELSEVSLSSEATTEGQRSLDVFMVVKEEDLENNMSFLVGHQLPLASLQLRKELDNEPEESTREAKDGSLLMEEQQKQLETLERQLVKEKLDQQLKEELEGQDRLVEKMAEEEEVLRKQLARIEGQVKILVELEEEQQEELTKTKAEEEEDKSRWDDLQAAFAESQEGLEILPMGPTEILEADKQELCHLFDHRKQVIMQLSEEWKTVSFKLVSVSTEKSDLKTSLEKLVTHGSTFKLKEQLPEKGKALISMRTKCLTEEQNFNSEQQIQLRKDHFTTSAELKSKISTEEKDVKRYSPSLEALRGSYSNVQPNTDSSSSSVNMDVEDHTHAEELLRMELMQQVPMVINQLTNLHALEVRLSEHYKKSSNEADQHLAEILSGVEKMKDIVDKVYKERDGLHTRLEEEIIRHEAQERDLQLEIESLRSKLFHANDLVTSLHGKGWEVLPLSPVAVKAAALFKSGLSTTQLHSKYVEVVEELEEKTPALQQLKREYDQTLMSNNNLTFKLNAQFEETEVLRRELEDAVCQSKDWERENARLKFLAEDLARQVKEHEESRVIKASSSRALSPSRNSREISSSSQEIIQELVDFKNMDELQEQNQQLLSVMSEMSEQNGEQKHTIQEQIMEYEEARGIKASSSRTQSHMTSSSSQVITHELVDFKNMDELQKQNQQLLCDVRELSEQNEEQKENIQEWTTEHEESRVIKASSSRALSPSRSSREISSSSQEIIQELIDFKNMDELQEQNQQLLSVMREMSEQNWEQKHTIQEQIMEYEEARGIKARRSRTQSHMTSSSSQVITHELVDFKNMNQLQKQNQQQLSDVRELSEQNEEQKETIQEWTTEHDEAKSVKASTSRVLSQSMSSSKISSSSQEIIQELVDFKNIDELQEQNQQLQVVTRELSEQNEEQKKANQEQTRVLQKHEKVRDVKASSSSALPQSMSCSEISSSSQVITQEVVDFKNMEELHKQNQQLQTLMRQFIEQNEEQEETIQEQTKEHEEARGVMVSSSRALSHNVSSSEIASSSPVTTQELVDFKNVDELWEQNQQLLGVVRELSEQNEEQKENVQEWTTVLLKEQEEASSSSALSHNVSSSEIASSSQVTTQELVDFKNMDELQKQNQQLLGVVRELSKQNEEQKEAIQEQTMMRREICGKLEKPPTEIKSLDESRGIEKEKVQATISQQDMHRSLQAQFTPLPRYSSLPVVLYSLQYSTLGEEATCAPLKHPLYQGTTE